MDKSLNNSAIFNVFDDRTLSKLMGQEQQKTIKLDLFDSSVTNKGIKDIAGSENSKFIDSINMGWNFSSITDEALNEIADSPYMNNITSLNLSDSEVSDEGLSKLALSKNSKNIKELILYGDYCIGDLSLKSISASSFMKNLVIIDLRSTCVTDKGIEMLCKSDCLNELEYLDVSLNFPKIGDGTLIALAFGKNIRKLRVLKCK